MKEPDLRFLLHTCTHILKTLEPSDSGADAFQLHVQLKDARQAEARTSSVQS